MPSTPKAKCVFEGKNPQYDAYTHIHTHSVRTQVRPPRLLLIMVAKLGSQKQWEIHTNKIPKLRREKNI